jgi:glycosyltransferase involved in cell wall biosynthesis
MTAVIENVAGRLPVEAAMRLCAVIPTYDNPGTIRSVVERVREHIADVIVVNDGSGSEGRAAVEALARDGMADVVHRVENGGKGAAVKDGLRRADERRFTHALQIDADGQHTIEDIPRLLEAARSDPRALVLAAPQFDGSAPKGRLMARKITIFWTNVETKRGLIHDPMCGFRVYPVKEALAASVRANYMDFDPEVAVRLAWAGLPVINVPTKVRYVSASEGGVSHFRLVKDNVLISWMHTRLVLSKWWAGLTRVVGLSG